MRYYEFRVPLSYTKDRELIEHIENYFPPDMSRAEIARQVIRCHKKVVETVGSPDNLDSFKPGWVQQLLTKLDNIKVVASAEDSEGDEGLTKNGFDDGGIVSFFEDD